MEPQSASLGNNLDTFLLSHSLMLDGTTYDDRKFKTEQNKEADRAVCS